MLDLDMIKMSKINIIREDNRKQEIQEKLAMHAKKKKYKATKAKPNQVCYNCRKKGYMSNECPYYWRLIGNKFYLVAPNSNIVGSKKIWIPKSHDSLSAVLLEV